MTNQEASKIIQDGLDDMSIDYVDNEQYQALQVAISALTALDKIYAELERLMKDYETDLMHFIPLLCVKETLDKYTKGEEE